jgi:hypothetical protein
LLQVEKEDLEDDAAPIERTFSLFARAEIGAPVPGKVHRMHLNGRERQMQQRKMTVQNALADLPGAIGMSSAKQHFTRRAVAGDERYAIHGVIRAFMPG